MDQRFLDRVIAIERRRRADCQGGVDLDRGVQGAEHLLEIIRAHGLEQCQVGLPKRFVAHLLRQLEQRKIGEVAPDGAAGTVAQ
ncbi:hypothetical protein D3C81_2037640 [compost metagenome]